MKNSFKATRNAINCQYKNIYCANKGLKWDFQKSLEMVNLHISFCTQFKGTQYSANENSI